MEDQDPITVLKAQFFLPRKLRRKTNYFWAFKKPVNRAIEMKIRKMKRNIIYHADLYATDVYDHYIEFVGKKDKLCELKSLERISEQLQAGILTPTRLRNAIYSRMLEEAADVQFVAAQEAAAAQQFIDETIVAAQRAKRAAEAALAAKEASVAAQFANEAAEAAKVASVAAKSAQLITRTQETFENAKKAVAAARDAKKAAAKITKMAVEAAQLAEDEATPEEAVVVLEKLGKLSLESCKGDEGSSFETNNTTVPCAKKLKDYKLARGRSKRVIKKPIRFH